MKNAVYGVMFSFLVWSGASYADEWASVATRTTLTNGQLCYTDGKDLICDATAPTANSGGLNASQICDETGSNCKDISAGWGAAITALDDIGDVEATDPGTNDILRFDGTNWVSGDNATLTRMRLTPNGSAGAGYTATTEGELTITWDGNAVITGGTIDGAVIGGGTAAAGSFTSLTASGLISGDELRAAQICDETGANCSDLSAGLGGAIDADSLNFTDLADSLILDATTNISTLTNDLTINTDDFVIDGATGYVGIGTAAPGADLDVAGGIRAQQICDETGSNCKDISAGWGAAITALDDIGDVEATSPATNDILSFDGDSWNAADAATLAIMTLTPDATAGAGYTATTESELTITWDGDAVITGGTIDGAVIGGGTPAAGTFTTVQLAEGPASCSTEADIGKMRFNTSTNKFQVCRP